MRGTGQLNNPYILETEDDLLKIHQNTSAYYLLVNDIILVHDWIPIPEFSGNINGNGYSISNLTIRKLNSNNITRIYIGFIEVMRPRATVRNLNLNTSIEGVDGDSATYNGVLAAQAYASPYGFLVENVSVSGNITTGGSRCGGLIGFCDSINSSIKECIVDVKINGRGGRYSAAVIAYLWTPVHAYNIFYKNTNGMSSAGIDATIITNFKSVEEYNNKIDFVKTWEIVNDISVPILRKPTPYIGVDTIVGFIEGTTLASNVELIDKHNAIIETANDNSFTFKNYNSVELVGSFIKINDKLTPLSYYTLQPQQKGYLTGSVSDTCSGTDFKIRCYREDGFFIGDYDIVKGSYEIPNLNVHSSYDVLLYDLNLAVETQVNSRRIPTAYSVIE